MTWFVYDPEDEFAIYQSEEAAKQAFEGRIEVWRKWCVENGEWDHDIDRVCMGKVTHEVELLPVDLPPEELLDLIACGMATEDSEFWDAFVTPAFDRQGCEQ